MTLGGAGGGAAVIRAGPGSTLVPGALVPAESWFAVLLRVARVSSQADTTRSRASGSTVPRIRRIVDSLGVAQPSVSPSRTRTPNGRSWAYSAMAM
jgi:hypothetical protein